MAFAQLTWRESLRDVEASLSANATKLYAMGFRAAVRRSTLADAKAGAGLPQFVKDEFDAFLECGILAHGFLRLRCGDCGQDNLVAFSCKRRGFSPSYGARRMAQTAAHLVDHVVPHAHSASVPPALQARTCCWWRTPKTVRWSQPTCWSAWACA